MWLRGQVAANFLLASLSNPAVRVIIFVCAGGERSVQGRSDRDADLLRRLRDVPGHQTDPSGPETVHPDAEREDHQRQRSQSGRQQREAAGRSKVPRQVVGQCCHILTKQWERARDVKKCSS